MVAGASHLIHTRAALLTSMSRSSGQCHSKVQPSSIQTFDLAGMGRLSLANSGATNCVYRFGSANLLTENDPERVKALISMNQSLTAFILDCIGLNEYLFMTYVWPITVSTWKAWKPNIP